MSLPLALLSGMIPAAMPRSTHAFTSMSSPHSTRRA
eukprot:CAMPEP_0167800154 /NCGR_PEP_ID=MMETSP0111_2-20121227/17546_1 /TAXON_ID=91324 /ORGANISM="Lotharella globosa, Strain CCCM811" /LENGTH=35 /DNA_ID= /DNA_START= /DNA_END= /DNA_ORIENTATION=